MRKHVKTAACLLAAVAVIVLFMVFAVPILSAKVIDRITNDPAGSYVEMERIISFLRSLRI